MIKAIISGLWLIFVILSFFPNTSNAATRLLSITAIRVSPEVENIIFRFNHIGRYRFIMLSNSYWYIAENNHKIEVLAKPHLDSLIKRVLVRNIRGETRVFVKMDDAFRYRYHIFASKDRRYIIVRAKIIKTAKTLTLKGKPTQKVLPNTAPIIVIDPGHGGKDPGAIGIFSKEKTITLDIAKDVAYYLRKMHYKVYLTRTGDTYPTLQQRAQFANRVHATLFVSIHANYAIKDKDKARGLEVYLLNVTSDKKALRLAARENGMTVQQLSDINKIILSLIQSSKIDKSKVLASDVYKEMLKEGRKVYRGYKGRGVKQAPFFVLVDTRCPSILVETAFINNPIDAFYLKKSSFRRKLALGIAKGIQMYLKSHLAMR